MIFKVRQIETDQMKSLTNDLWVLGCGKNYAEKKQEDLGKKFIRT